MTAPGPMLIVEHVMTDDLDDGRPVRPGFVDEGIYWTCVRRLPNGETLWRRIRLAETRSAVAARSSGPSLIGGNGKGKEKAMDMTKYSGVHFIKLNDVLHTPIRQTIVGVEVDERFGKPVLTFESGEKFSVNSTNNRILLRACGKHSSDWIGKEIELYAGEVEFQNKMQPAVIVRPISPAEMNDSIPF
jgi:hypothetical protein